MSLPIVDFWNLVAQSRLLTTQECQALGAEFASQAPGAVDATPLVEWLVKRRVVSPFHAKVLLAKRPGPFHYGNYKVLDRVDKGRLAGMFKAIHQPTRQPVGLHFLSGAIAADRDALARLAARTAAASRVRHPCLWGCHQLVDQGAFKFVAVAWHDGQSLEEMLPKDKPLPPVEACRIVRQAAHGLAELHKAGLPHGDIRPANLWLDKAGNVKLLHTPLTAEPLPRSKRSAEQLSAAADYLAPEIGKDDRPADAAADIYGLGCTLYQALGGRPPFAGGDAANKQQRHATETPAKLDKINSSVPRALAQVVEHMLAKNPAQRLGSAKNVLDALAPFVPPAKAAVPNEPLTAEAQAYEQFLKNPGPMTAAPVSAVPVGAPVHAGAPVAVAVPAGNGHAAAPLMARAAPAGVPAGMPVAVAAGAGAPAIARAVPVGSAAGVPAVAAAPVMAQAVAVSAMPMAAAPMGVEPAFASIPAVSTAPGGIGMAKRRAARRKNANTMLLLASLALLAGGGVAAVFVYPKLFPPAPADQPPGGTQVATTAVSVDKTTAGKSVEGNKSAGADSKKPAGTKGEQNDDDTAAPQSDPSTERLLGLEEPVWRTPTHGQPIDLAYMPAGLKATIVLRPAEITKHAEGARILNALGPLGEFFTNKVKSFSGISPEGVERAIIGLIDSGAENPPAVTMVLHLVATIDEEEIQADWGNPTESTIGGIKVFVGQQSTYYLPADGNGKLLVVTTATQEDKLTEWLESTKQPPLLLPHVESLRRATDADRHFTMLFEPDFFVNGGGKGLFTGPVERMKSPLVSFLSEDSGQLPRAASFSAHLTDDFFLELMAIGTANEESLLLAKSYCDRVKGFSDAYEEYNLRLNPHDYGKRVLGRFPAMLKQMGYHTVAATDEKQKLAIARCYLPGIAAHNLALATQLAVLETPGGAAAVSVAATGNKAPETLADKIKQKITLSFPRNTLEKCMELFAEEIGAPVEIIGGDLQLEGITKNQSFGLDEKDQPAVDILKKVMARSNPDGKLIYVIKEKNGKETLFITTRAAAAKRGDKISADQELPKK